MCIKLYSLLCISFLFIKKLVFSPARSNALHIRRGKIDPSDERIQDQLVLSGIEKIRNVYMCVRACVRVCVCESLFAYFNVCAIKSIHMSVISI